MWRIHPCCLAVQCNSRVCWRSLETHLWGPKQRRLRKYEYKYDEPQYNVSVLLLVCSICTCMCECTLCVRTHVCIHECTCVVACYSVSDLCNQIQGAPVCSPMRTCTGILVSGMLICRALIARYVLKMPPVKLRRWHVLQRSIKKQELPFWKRTRNAKQAPVCGFLSQRQVSNSSCWISLTAIYKVGPHCTWDFHILYTVPFLTHPG